MTAASTIGELRIEAGDPALPRQAARRAVQIVGRLREQGHTAVDVAVHDLSTHGFQVETVYRLRPGTLVWLQVPNLAPLAARVRWFRNYRIGCAFEKPLYPGVLDRIVASVAGR